MRQHQIMASLLGCIALAGCFEAPKPSYNPYAGVSAYRSPPPKSSSSPRSSTTVRSSQSHRTPTSTVSANYHGNHVSPPPVAPTNYGQGRKTISTPNRGDVGQPFQFPEFEFEHPSSRCEYPRTDCRIDLNKLPGGAGTSKSRPPGYGKVIPQ